MHCVFIRLFDEDNNDRSHRPKQPPQRIPGFNCRMHALQFRQFLPFYLYNYVELVVSALILKINVCTTSFTTRHNSSAGSFIHGVALKLLMFRSQIRKALFQMVMSRDSLS